MELNDSTIKKLRWLIIFTVIAVVAGINYRSLFALIVRAVGILTPFLLGGVMAFVLNVPMRAIERILPVKKESQFRRPLSLVLTFVFVIGILLVVTFVVMPQLFDTVLSLQYSLPVFFNDVKQGAEKLFAQYPEISDSINNIQIDWKSYLEKIVQFLSVGAGTVLSSTLSAALNIISGVTTFAIGVVFAVYILLQKENLSRQIKKFMKAFLPDHVSNRILEVLSLTSRTFSNFLTGQCVEAVILGSMFFLTLSICTSYWSPDRVYRFDSYVWGINRLCNRSLFNADGEAL